jgi:restriction endonuclease S subunit
VLDSGEFPLPAIPALAEPDEADRSKAESRFVYYALLAPNVQQTLHGSTMSAGVPHINLATFRKLTLPVPPLRQQKQIVVVLGGRTR